MVKNYIMSSSEVSQGPLAQRLWLNADVALDSPLPNTLAGLASVKLSSSDLLALMQTKALAYSYEMTKHSQMTGLFMCK